MFTTLHWDSGLGMNYNIWPAGAETFAGMRLNNDAYLGFPTQGDFSQWHTSGVEWTPGQVVYTLDGVPYRTVQTPNIAAKDMYLGLQAHPMKGFQVNTPINFYVDWVAQYSYEPVSAASGGLDYVPGTVAGWVDGVHMYGDSPHIVGWACGLGVSASIPVHVYVGGGAGAGSFAGGGHANVASDPAVSAACRDFSGTAHRFAVPVDPAFAGQPVFVYGFSPTGGATALLSNSGAVTVTAPNVGPIAGYLDGVVFDGSQYFISGWACARGSSRSIDVHLYVGGAAGAGVYAGAAAANLYSEEVIGTICGDSSLRPRRFSIHMNEGFRLQFGGQPIFVHGIHPYGQANSLIDNSGGSVVPAWIGM